MVAAEKVCMQVRRLCIIEVCVCVPILQHSVAYAHFTLPPDLLWVYVSVCVALPPFPTGCEEMNDSLSNE